MCAESDSVQYCDMAEEGRGDAENGEGRENDKIIIIMSLGSVSASKDIIRDPNGCAE